VWEERREGEIGCMKEARRSEGRHPSTASNVLEHKHIVTCSSFS
jgi:hypothetical protein